MRARGNHPAPGCTETMSAYEVDIKDAATIALQRKIAGCRPQRLNGFIGPAVAKLTRENFRSQPENKMGWPSTGFWRDAATSTNWQPLPDGVVISVPKQGVRQRYQGGTISAVNAGALTIPVSAQAYGHRASEFPGAFLMKTPKGAWIAQYGGGRKRDATLEFLFKLVGSVDQKPNPAVLPSNEEITTTALGAAEKAVAT